MAFLLEDADEKAFEAALSVLEDYDFDEVDSKWHSPQQLVECLDDCDSKVQTSTAEKKRKQANERKRLLRSAGVYGDPNRTRKQRTREIADLRDQLANLQLHLEELKSEKEAPLQSALVASKAQSQVANLWQEMAERQRLRREAAERYNARLKLATERQQRVADSLTMLLQKRTNQLVIECSSLLSAACAESQIVPVLAFNGDIGEFEGLLRSLDASYRDIDTVFESSGLAELPLSRADVHLREGVNGNSLELFMQKELPFDVLDTAEATWDHFKGVKKHIGNGNVYEKMAKDLEEPYTIIEDFTKEMSSNNARADVRMKQVMRRIVEKDRDIVLWTTRVAPAQVKNRLRRGLTYFIRGYAITKRSSTLPNSTQQQFCRLITLDGDAERMYSPEDLQTLTNFLIVYTAQNMRVHQKRMENALVDKTIT